MLRTRMLALAASLVALGLSGPALGTGSPLWAWGYNNLSQLGLGDVTSRSTPVEVTFFSDKTVTALAAGSNHTLALTSDGKLWAWGVNSTGQLGLGDLSIRSTPTQVTFFSGQTVTMAAAGAGHSLALTSDGRLWAWGRNVYGQLGLGDTTDRSTPAEVTFLLGKTITAVAAGTGHTLAVTSDGKLWAWGANAWGQLGLGDTSDRWAPTEVTFFAGQTVSAPAAGVAHTLAVTSDGKLWAWGRNDIGQLGLGDSSSRNTPTEVTALSGQIVTDTAAGWHHSLARTSGGRLWGCGYNSYGQLGLGDTTNRLTATEVTVFSGLTVTDMAAGYEHTLVLTAGGRLWTSGRNNEGQLGVGDTTDRWNPTQVTTFSSQPITAPTAGSYHSLALIRDNTIPVAHPQTVYATTGLSKDVALTGSDGDGDPLTYHIVTPPSHGGLTGTPPNVIYTSDPEFADADSFTFKVNDGYDDSAPAVVSIIVQRADTSTYTINRSGIMTELTILRGYLRRAADSAWIVGRTITFKIDGSAVGTGVTDANGHAPLNWVITGGPTTRTIAAEFAGDAAYNPSGANATLTALTSGTKMEAYDRTGRITQYTDFKAVLFRADNSPLPNKTIAFSIDGTGLGTDVTRVNGEAKVGYIIPSGVGAGTRSILHEFAGDAGYAAISRTRTLTVQKALPYIWVMSRSCLLGHKVALYAYFRRLYDYQKQVGKTVDFRVDGTLVHTLATNADGVAYYIYQTVEPKGAHTIRCEFAGDAWVEPGFGQGTLTIL